MLHVIHLQRVETLAVITRVSQSSFGRVVAEICLTSGHFYIMNVAAEMRFGLVASQWQQAAAAVLWSLGLLGEGMLEMEVGCGEDTSFW